MFAIHPLLVYPITWAFAGMAAAFVLPKIRPHLGYLAVYFGLVLSLAWVCITVYLRMFLTAGVFFEAARFLLITLPWGGVLLALYWRLHPAAQDGADPLRQRLFLFVGLALADVLLLALAEVLYVVILFSAPASMLVIVGNVLRFSLFPLVCIGVAVALMVRQAQPFRKWIISFMLGLALLQVSRFFLTFTGFDNQYFGFLPFLAVPLAALARRKLMEGRIS